MKTLKIIKSFPTIDLCVDYLVNQGCKWDHKKETELNKNKSFQYKDIIVFYDKYGILD